MGREKEIRDFNKDCAVARSLPRLAGPAELTPAPPRHLGSQRGRQPAYSSQEHSLLELISLLIQLAQLSVFNYSGPSGPLPSKSSPRPC